MCYYYKIVIYICKMYDYYKVFMTFNLTCYKSAYEMKEIIIRKY